MSNIDSKLVGEWRKTGREACAERYAANLRFDANGLYFGEAERPGEFTLWDNGTWRLVEQGTLAMSTANDAVVRYGYALVGDSLIFTDPTGCRFSYARRT